MAEEAIETTVAASESSGEEVSATEQTATTELTEQTAAQSEQEAAANAESERNAELLTQNENLTAANTSLSEENAQLKEEIAVLNHKIKSEYKADALLIAKAMMKEDSGIDLNQALDKTLEKFPVFIDRILDLGSSTPGVSHVGSNSGFVKGLSDAIYNF